MSESGAGPADRAGAPQGQGQPSGARDALELVPHSGRVAIEVVDGQTWAVDSSTLRMDALPAGCWSAEADAEGFVCFLQKMCFAGACGATLALESSSSRSARSRARR